ncbi:STM4015 family protein [Streptomyces yaizuensis]|uniref:STM4015 family protein n=1 Tax=Streptomyces yaizuensis TaxID=2989713 RepID=A0ABQ5P7A9_9ACTN|nr:STM4015 family protein [Streptomyces sp. YSPA8]GLF98456.1 STM4015 family protein [Streptomyces sp. YSPA8]
MPVSHHEELHGLPVFDFPAPGETGRRSVLPPAADVAWRICVDSYQDDGERLEWEEEFARFLDTVDASAVRALIVGAWRDPYERGSETVVAALTAAADRLPALRALFIGDMEAEQCEISWITQSRVTPVLDAFPELLEFRVRGSDSLEFPAVRHARLRTLAIESGGLDAGVVRGVAASDLPALETLDLWLGTSWYGATSGVADLEPFLTGVRLPALRHLALRNSEIQDRIAAALAGAPVVARLERLDLSMGTLGDEGAEALLNGQPLTHLTSLDLSHHYLGRPMMERLTTVFGGTGVELDLSDAQIDNPWWDSEEESRYTAVGE